MSPVRMKLSPEGSPEGVSAVSVSLTELSLLQERAMKVDCEDRQQSDCCYSPLAGLFLLGSGHKQSRRKDNAEVRSAFGDAAAAAFWWTCHQRRSRTAS